jgi:TonB family protein
MFRSLVAATGLSAILAGSLAAQTPAPTNPPAQTPAPAGTSAQAPAPAGAPAAAPAADERRRPRELKVVAPGYPDEARAARAEGMVAINVDIDAEGNVTSARVATERGLPFLHVMLEAAAIEALKQWKFEPTLKDGVAVPIRMPVIMQFAAPPSVRINLKLMTGYVFQLAIPLPGRSLYVATPKGERLVFVPTLREGSTTDVTLAIYETTDADAKLLENVELKLEGGPLKPKTESVQSLELVDVLLEKPVPPGVSAVPFRF